MNVRFLDVWYDEEKSALMGKYASSPTEFFVVMIQKSGVGDGVIFTPDALRAAAKDWSRKNVEVQTSKAAKTAN